MRLFADDGTRLKPAPRTVAILGMGPTLQDFIQLQLQSGGQVVDEVWGTNNVLCGARCDVGFIMDDFVEMLERPAKDAIFWDKSNPALMNHCRDTKVPIFTSKAYPERYPTTMDFPIEAVMKEVFQGRNGWAPHNTTSYAILYAWYLGVKQLHLYGVDFAYPWHDPYDQRKFLEEGRANVESLLLAGLMLGKFTFHLSARTSLFNTLQGRPYYGYADGRKAMTEAMITTMNSEKIENDHRVIPSKSTRPGAAAAYAPVVGAAGTNRTGGTSGTVTGSANDAPAGTGGAAGSSGPSAADGPTTGE